MRERAGLSPVMWLVVASVIMLIVAVAVMGGFGNVWQGFTNVIDLSTSSDNAEYCENRVKDWCQRHPGEDWTGSWGQCRENIVWGEDGNTCCPAEERWDPAAGTTGQCVQE